MPSAGAILFDFDGTLVDARESAWELFQRTNERFSLGLDRREDFFGAFEGNFHEAIERTCPDRAQAAAATDHFFGLLRSEYFPHVIPGMADVVRALATHFTLAVLSSNTIGAIRRILEEAGIATCFSHVFAGDVERSKAVAIRSFLADRSYASLRHCSPAYDSNGASDLATDDVTLVTDTIGDVMEATRCGIHAIGVAWGMHDPASLTAAGAERIALWPQELTAWFTSGLAECDDCRAGTACARPAEQTSTPATLDAAGAQRCERRTALRRQAALPALDHRRGSDDAAPDLRAAIARSMGDALTKLTRPRVGTKPVPAPTKENTPG